MISITGARDKFSYAAVCSEIPQMDSEINPEMETHMEDWFDFSKKQYQKKKNSANNTLTNHQF